MSEQRVRPCSSFHCGHQRASCSLGLVGPNPQRASAPRMAWARSLLRVQESSCFHTLSGVGNTSVSEEPTGSHVNTARSAEGFLGLLIPNCIQMESGASVGTVQLNTSLDLARALWLPQGREWTFEKLRGVIWALMRSNRQEQRICNPKTNCLINLFLSSSPVEM